MGLEFQMVESLGKKYLSFLIIIIILNKKINPDCNMLLTFCASSRCVKHPECFRPFLPMKGLPGQIVILWSQEGCSASHGLVILAWEERAAANSPRKCLSPLTHTCIFLADFMLQSSWHSPYSFVLCSKADSGSAEVTGSRALARGCLVHLLPAAAG